MSGCVPRMRGPRRGLQVPVMVQMLGHPKSLRRDERRWPPSVAEPYCPIYATNSSPVAQPWDRGVAVWSWCRLCYINSLPFFHGWKNPPFQNLAISARSNGSRFICSIVPLIPGELTTIPFGSINDIAQESQSSGDSSSFEAGKAYQERRCVELD